MNLKKHLFKMMSSWNHFASFEHFQGFKGLYQKVFCIGWGGLSGYDGLALRYDRRGRGV